MWTLAPANGVPCVADQAVGVSFPPRDTYTLSLAVDPGTANMDMFVVPTYGISLHEPPELIGNVIETLAGINQFIDGRVLPTVKALL